MKHNDVPPGLHAEYRYAMVNRPFDIGTAPKEGFVRTEDRPARDAEHFDVARHGIVVYSRELSDAETKSFELALIPSAQQLAKVAAAVAEEMREYARQYREMAETDPVEFGDLARGRAKAIATGYPVSVGDAIKFAALVQGELAAIGTPNADAVPVEQHNVVLNGGRKPSTSKYR